MPNVWSMGHKTTTSILTAVIFWALGTVVSAAGGRSPLPQAPLHPPKYIFKADYERGLYPFGIPWGDMEQQGGKLEVIVDPTSSSNGYVQRRTHKSSQ